MHYVIIGNSTAAVGCIEGIRRIDQNSPITVISKEKHHTYSRPLISYLLCGKTDEVKMQYRPNSFYRDMNCIVLLGKTVSRILTDEKLVLLDGGEAIQYDKLLIATGSYPVIPPINGLEQVENRFTFMSLDDARALDTCICEDSRVLIMGAGLIGLKCAEGIAEKVKSVTVVDLAERILPSILDEESSVIVKKHIEKHDVAFILSDGVKEFHLNAALLQSGKKIEFDVLVIAVGVRANTQLAAEAGVCMNRGIVTDRNCRTSIPDIYAAGDCTESFDISTDESHIMAILPNAYMQGEVAGIHMACGEKSYDKAIPMNSIGFFGLHVITAGCCKGDEYVKNETENYKKLVSKDNLLKGYILVGDVARAGIYTSLIKEKTPLDLIDYELIKERPQLMAFSQKERAKQLGGARK